MYIDYGWGIQLWYTEKYGNFISRVFFLGGGGWGGKRGRNLHDFSIKSIYGTTTLMRFKDIWKIRLVYDIQVHKFCESENSLYCYFKLVKWQCHLFTETHTSFLMFSLELCNFATLERKCILNGLLVFNLFCLKLP